MRITTLVVLLLAFFRMNLGTVASVMAIANGAQSLFGGNQGTGGYAGGTGTSVPVYVPTGQVGADQQWQALLNAMSGNVTGASGQITPQLAQSFQNMLGISGQPLIQAGQQAGGQYPALAQQAQGYGADLGQAGVGALGRGASLWQQGADPQNALHDYLQQQVVDNSRAATSARGLGMGPYSGGLENQATTNFNLDWQNALLGRSLAASQGANQANQMAGADFSGGLNMGALSPQFTMQGAQVPIQAQQAAYQLPADAATNYMQQLMGASVSPMAGIQSQIIPYLNYGAGAGNYAANAGLNQGYFQQQQQGQGLERLIGGLGGISDQASNPGSWLGSLFGTGGATVNTPGGGGYGSNVDLYGGGSPIGSGTFGAS